MRGAGDYETIAENTSIVVGNAIDWPTICSR
jgi:hypothetical protein